MRWKRNPSIACVLATVAALAGCAGEISLSSDGRFIETRVKEIATPPEGVALVFYSDDGEHVAWIAREPGAMRLVHDGIAGPVYQRVDKVTFSPDGSRLAYRAAKDEKRFIVCDGVEQKRYAEVSEPIFSPDGKRLAYVAREELPSPGIDNFVVCDGVEQRDYACARRAGRRSFSRWGRRLGGMGETIPCFSPDSKHLVYQTVGNGGMRLLINGVEGPPYAEVTSLKCLPDRLRFVVRDDSRTLRVVDVDWPGVSAAGESEIAHLITRLGDKKRAVREDATRKLITMGPGVRAQVLKAQKDSSDPELLLRCQCVLREVSMLNERTVRIVSEGTPWVVGPNGEFVIPWRRPGDRVTVVTKAGEAEVEGSPMRFVFSPDGGRFAYCRRARGRRAMKVVIDRKVMGPDLVGGLTFSPDGRHFAYLARREEDCFILCDGMMTPARHHVASMRRWTQMLPVFSPDSHHLAYPVLHDRSQYVVCDGIESPAHDWVRIPRRYDKTPGKFRYLTRDGDQTWLVEVAWPRDLDWTNGLKPMAEQPKE